MKTLINASVEEICNFVLNGKIANGIELNPEREESPQGDNGFIDKVVYKDKSVEIIYSYCNVPQEGETYIIENIYIYSKWWGRIKNSFLMCDEFTGKSEYTRCAVFSLGDFRAWNHKGSVQHEIHNRNKVLPIEVTDFDTLVKHCQRVYKMPATYRVTEVISLSPNTWVEVEINLPKGKSFRGQGANKKEAVNKLAVQLFKNREL
jgi:hypothetical protein